MARSPNLPDYGAPPINEVALGVQFRPADGYQQIRAGEVWSLFKSHYPRVEEHPAIPPQFETFGPLQVQQPEFQFVSGALHDRFWFVNEHGDELLQFQNDRFLSNWRNTGLKPYPRFDVMAKKFKDNIQKLEAYFSSVKPQSLDINQCDVTYINEFHDVEEFKFVDDYIKCVSFGKRADDFNFTYRRALSAENGEKYARLTCQGAPAITRLGKRIFSLTLSVRGKPSGSSISDAIRFLENGRDIIVREFTDLTTEKAHKFWERIR